MRVVFRADSSQAIGTGHVTRCLTLAERLHACGAEIVFVCRSWPRDASPLVLSAGFQLCQLPPLGAAASEAPDNYAAWLGVPQEQDATETLSVITQLQGPVDWLVVDHYGIDAAWHRMIRPHVGSLMVIDDLANRSLECDVLLDQNLAAERSTRYASLVPTSCRMILGPEGALLRPEFGAHRKRVQPRDGRVRRLFVFYGGVDHPNMTVRALHAIRAVGMSDVDIDVVVGGSNPHLQAIENMCRSLPRVTIAHQVTDMAVRMARADLALGAGGTTTWERCCMGVPSLIVALAENQVPIGEEAERLGVGRYLGHERDVTPETLQSRLQWALDHSAELRTMSAKAMQLVDGAGASRVAQVLAEWPTKGSRKPVGDVK
jgi:UDP-2,4-diacetamido-2,4,6-trideoxy-beta-L-altropyranose hydrolase